MKFGLCNSLNQLPQGLRVYKDGGGFLDNDCPLYRVDSILENILNRHVEGDLAENESDIIKVPVN